MLYFNVETYLAAYSFEEENDGFYPFSTHFFFKNKIKKNLQKLLTAQARKM